MESSLVAQQPPTQANKAQLEQRDNSNMALQLISVIARMSHANLLSSGSIVYYLGAVLAAVLFVLALAINALLQHFYIDAIYFSRAGHISYLIQHIFPNKVVQVLFDIVVIVLPFGTLASQILTISKMIAQTIENNSNIVLLKFNYLLIACVAFLLIFPLCAIKSPRVFAKIQPFSAAAALIYTFVLLAYGSKRNICSVEDHEFVGHIMAFRRDKTGAYLFLDFLRYMPTVIFAINITVSVPIVHRDITGSPALRRDTLRKNMMIGTLAVFAMFCISGFSTATFGSSTLPSNLDTFGQCKMLIFDILGLIYAVVLLIAYPLWLQPNRICLMQMMRVRPDNYIVFLLLGFGIIAITMLLAMFVTDIQVIFGLFASLCGYFLYFVIPLTCCIKMTRLRQKMLDEEAQAAEQLAPAVEEHPANIDSVPRWSKSVDTARLKSRIYTYEHSGTARLVLSIAVLVLFALICGVAFVMNVLYFVK